MNKQSRGGRPSSDSSRHQRVEDDVDQEFGENERTQKDAVGGAPVEDDSLLAGDRKDVASEPGRGGKSAEDSSDKSGR